MVPKEPFTCRISKESCIKTRRSEFLHENQAFASFVFCISPISFSYISSPTHSRALLHHWMQDWMLLYACLLYTSDAADDLLCVDLGGRRIIKKQKKQK